MNEFEMWIYRNRDIVDERQTELMKSLTSGKATIPLIVDIVEGAEMADLTIAIQRLLMQDSSKDSEIESLLRNTFMKSVRDYAAFTLKHQEQVRLSSITKNHLSLVKATS